MLCAEKKQEDLAMKKASFLRIFCALHIGILGCGPTPMLDQKQFSESIVPGDLCFMYECDAIGQAIAHVGEWHLGVAGFFCFPLRKPPTIINCPALGQRCEQYLGICQ